LRILITTFRYYPEPSPRAFRAHELVKEFCRKGHKVKLVMPWKETIAANPSHHQNLETVFIDRFLTKTKNVPSSDTKFQSMQSKTNSKRRTFFSLDFFKKKIKPTYLKYLTWKKKYFPPFYEKQYAQNLFNYLKKEDKYDVVISIGLPIENHIGTALGLWFNKELRKSTVTIADYGDPYYYHEGRNMFFLYFFIDYFVAKTFKFISIPTTKALKSYLPFKKKEKILILPQALNIKEFNIQAYKKNEVSTFAYAGVLYKKIREPVGFLDYIANLEKDFRFVFYTIEKYDTLEILSYYKDKLGDKLILKMNYERKKIIEDLSQMDFLINFEYSTSNQIPSKLIDYAIANRPVCAISNSDFDALIFNKFLAGDYSNDVGIKLDENYDIENIVNKIKSL
jgi:hypothetical protein